MDNIIGKFTRVMIKIAFIISIVAMLLAYTATILITYIPAVESYLGFSFGNLTVLSGILTATSVAAGFSAKMTGVVNTINTEHRRYVKKTSQLQEQYFDKGVDTIQTQLSAQKSDFDDKTNLYKQELSLKNTEIEQLKKDINMKSRLTADLKSRRLGVKNED